MRYLEQDQIRPSNPVEKLLRRGALTIAERSRGRFAMGEALAIQKELGERIISSSTGYERAARTLIRENTMAFFNNIYVRPSRAHRDRFRRDEFFICQYADSPHLNLQVLRSMADSQDPETGYIPTSQFAFGEPKKGFTFPDETTNYFSILLYQTTKKYPTLAIPDKLRKAAGLAAKYISAQIDKKSGYWINRGTTRTYWADELILPDGDTPLYTQGLAAIALTAAYEMRMLKTSDLVNETDLAFARIARKYGNGRIPLSVKTSWIDVSALYPVYLAKILFDKDLVDKDTVKRTIESFVTRPPAKGALVDLGIPVIRDEGGNYLSEDYFVHPDVCGEFMDRKGEYQNGGNWLWADHAAWAAARLFGVDLSFLPPHFQALLDENQIIKTTIDKDFPEYTLTGRINGEIQVNPARCRHTMDVTILDQQRKVEEYLSSHH